MEALLKKQERWARHDVPNKQSGSRLVMANPESIQLSEQQMSAGPIEQFTLDHENEADDYLKDLLRQPELRSMDEVEKRAKALIKDDRLRDRFIAKAKATLASLP
jgi:hypothetical protein